jgi:hypothetical protein
MGFVFVKLTPGEIISSSGGLVFRKLTTLTDPIPPDPPEPTQKGFDLSQLGLPPGTYKITVTANAENRWESEKSNAVIYTVE